AARRPSGPRPRAVEVANMRGAGPGRARRGRQRRAVLLATQRGLVHRGDGVGEVGSYASGRAAVVGTTRRRSEVDMRVTGFGYGVGDGASAAARAVEGAIGADLNGIRADLRRRSGPAVDAVAAFLGIPTTALQADMTSGKSLAAIARAHGKTAAD